VRGGCSGTVQKQGQVHANAKTKKRQKKANHTKQKTDHLIQRKEVLDTQNWTQWLVRPGASFCAKVLFGDGQDQARFARHEQWPLTWQESLRGTNRSDGKSIPPPCADQRNSKKSLGQAPRTPPICPPRSSKTRALQQTKLPNRCCRCPTR